MDTRKAEEFASAHIAGSVNIGLDGGFATWVGALIPTMQQSILLIAEPGREEEAISRMARIGYHQCAGYLAGGAAGMDYFRLSH